MLFYKKPLYLLVLLFGSSFAFAQGAPATWAGYIETKCDFMDLYQWGGPSGATNEKAYCVFFGQANEFLPPFYDNVLTVPWAARFDLYNPTQRQLYYLNKVGIATIGDPMIAFQNWAVAANVICIPFDGNMTMFGSAKAITTSSIPLGIAHSGMTSLTYEKLHAQPGCPPPMENVITVPATNYEEHPDLWGEITLEDIIIAILRGPYSGPGTNVPVFAECFTASEDCSDAALRSIVAQAALPHIQTVCNSYPSMVDCASDPDAGFIPAMDYGANIRVRHPNGSSDYKIVRFRIATGIDPITNEESAVASIDAGPVPTMSSYGENQALTPAFELYCAYCGGTMQYQGYNYLAWWGPKSHASDLYEVQESTIAITNWSTIILDSAPGSTIHLGNILGTRYRFRVKSTVNTSSNWVEVTISNPCFDPDDPPNPGGEW